MKTKYLLQSTQSGFSLLELMISITLLSLLTLTLFMGLNFTIRAWGISDTRIELEQNVRNSLDWMSMELREATTYSTGEAVLDPSMSVATSNCLQFTKPAKPFNINVPTVQTTKYELNGSNLIRTVNGLDTTIVASGITKFFVHHEKEGSLYNNELFIISVGAVTTVADKTYNIQLQTKARVRSI